MSELFLEVYESVGQVRRIPLKDGDALKVGRTQGCDVVVATSTISRVHCEVVRKGDVVRVVNLSSTKSGTTVNGKRVDDGVVAPGDEVGLGDVVLRVVSADAGAPRPAKRTAPAPAPEDEGDEDEGDEDEGDEDGEPPAATKRKAAPPPEAEAPREGRKALVIEADDSSIEARPPLRRALDAPDAPDAGRPGSARSRGARDAEPAGPRAADAAAGTEEEDDDDDEPEPGSARASARAFVRRKRLEQRIKLVATLGVVALLAGLAAWGVVRYGRDLVDYATAPPAPPPPPWVTGDPILPPPGSGDPLGDTPSAGADETWATVRGLPPQALAAGLRSFVERFPDDRRAEDAAFYARALEAAERTSGTRRVEAVAEALAAEGGRAHQARDLARARALFELASSLVPGTARARALEQSQQELRVQAQEAVEALRGEATALAQQLGAVQAIITVLDARPRLRGLGQDEVLDRLVTELEEQAARELAARTPRTVELTGRATTVETEGLNAALRLDFVTAWQKLDELLLLAIDDAHRLRVHWLRAQVRALQDVFQAMAQAASAPDRNTRPSLTVAGTLRARLREATDQGLVLEPIVERGEGELRWPWRRVTPYQLQELFGDLGAADLRLSLAKAFHAFSTGLEDRGVELLLPWAQRDRTRGEAFSFYALASGVSMPEGGFVVFEGRLVSPQERESVLAARQAAREAAAELAQAASEVRERQRLLALLQRVLALLDEGHYEAGLATLQRFAQRHAAVEGVGDVAQRRLQSPCLRRRDLRLSRDQGRNGPPANRLDVYLMGDGFVLDDQKQVQFDRYADEAWRFCQLQDFFKEYDLYINYWAVNTVSQEEGLTKDGTERDTCLRGRIDGGTYTIPDHGHVFDLLERSFPGEHDRLVVGIGNDFANVATGGGGIVACAKTMLSAVPHELGHAFGGLGDEYESPAGGGQPPPQATGHVEAAVLAPNLVAGNVRDEVLAVVPWRGWLDATGGRNWTGRPVDIFEGGSAQPHDMWRPQQACVMRDIGSPFCAPCMETMVKALYRVVRPIDRVWPEEQELTAQGTEAITLRVLVMKPKTHDLFVHWRRRGAAAPRVETGEGDEPPDPEGTRERDRPPPRREGEPEYTDISGRLTTDGFYYIHFIKVYPRELEPGTYEFSAKVWDPTPWVLEESRELLTQTRTWTITIPPR